MISATLPRLDTLDRVSATAQRPKFDPDRHGVGIVHLGLGPSFQAHQAPAIDSALEAEGGDWRVLAGNLHGGSRATALSRQHGLFTLLQQHGELTEARVIGALAGTLDTAEDALNAMCSESVRIVSLTEFDLDDDHSGSGDPRLSALVLDALERRRMTGRMPFTVLSCERLPHNGERVRGKILSLALKRNGALHDWIARHVDFPACVADRLVPEPDEGTVTLAQELSGCQDDAAVVCESYFQWVIEDRFSAGRPAWEAGGVRMVDRIERWQELKYRLVDGSLSVLGFHALLCNVESMQGAMKSPALMTLVQRHLRASASTLKDFEDVVIDQEIDSVMKRLQSPLPVCSLNQFAENSTRILSTSLLEPAVQVLEQKGPVRAYAFAVAGWMAWCLGEDGQGRRWAVNDSRAEEIARRLDGSRDVDVIVHELQSLQGLFPQRLREDQAWLSTVRTLLSRWLRDGPKVAVEFEAEQARQYLERSRYNRPY